MMHLRSIFLVCAAFAAVPSQTAKPLTNYQYLQLLISSHHLTLTEAQQGINDGTPLGKEVRIIPERLVDSETVADFVKQYSYKTTQKPVTSVPISDETYIQLLTKPNYMMESDLEQANSVVDSTKTLPDRKIKGSVISRVLKQLELSQLEKLPMLELPTSFGDSSLTDSTYVKLLSTESCLTSTELQERVNNHIPIPTDAKILNDRLIDAITVSDFVKSRGYTLAVEPVVNTRVSDEDYIKTLTNMEYTTENKRKSDIKNGYDIVDFVKPVPDREIDATVLSSVLKDLQAILAAMDPKSLTDNQYMALLSAPEFITETEAEEYGGKLPSDVTVLPERKLDAKKVLKTMKEVGKNINTAPTYGKFETDEDYVKLLSAYNVDLESNKKRYGSDMIASQVFLPDKKVSGSAFSRVMKKMQVELLKNI